MRGACARGSELSVHPIAPDLNAAASTAIVKLERHNDILREAMTNICAKAITARASSDYMQHFNAVRLIAGWAEDALERTK